MNKHSFPIAAGDQFCKHVTQSDAWIVSSIVCERFETWMVGAVYLKGDDIGPMIKIVKKSDRNVVGIATVSDVTMHPEEDLVAVALDPFDVRLFRLVPPVGEMFAFATCLDVVKMPGTRICQGIGWIAPSDDPHTLAVLSEGVGMNSVRLTVHGGFKSLAPTKDEILQAKQKSIFCFCTGYPGVIAFVGSMPPVLQVLVRASDGKFHSHNTPLNTSEKKNLSALATGSMCVAVGYAATNMSGGAHGLVEIYRIGETLACTMRCIPHGIPTALCCSGPRVLIGAGLATPDTPIQLNTKEVESTVYLCSVESSENFILCKAGGAHLHWPARSLNMTDKGWCYARRVVVSENNGAVQEAFTVVDHACVGAR